MTENPLGENPLGPHYPASWEEFIGQDQVKYQLKIHAMAARARSTRMPHILIASPIPGCGKTSLALLAAMQRGTNIRIASDIKPNQVPLVFTDMEDGDVLFIDEVHKVVDGGKRNGEWLYHYMQDGVLLTALGPQPAPAVTIIGATTDAGRLPKPLEERFEERPTLVPYSDGEGLLIALQLSRRVLAADGLPLPTEEAAAEIARAGNNSPRLMLRVLIAVRDLAWAGEIDKHSGAYDLARALQFAGVTPDGLTAQAQEYMRVLYSDFRGNPAGKVAIADRIGEVGSGMREIEMLLLNKKLIALTGRGRVLTIDGIKRARALVEEKAA